MWSYEISRFKYERLIYFGSMIKQSMMIRFHDGVLLYIKDGSYENVLNTCLIVAGGSHVIGNWTVTP